MQKGRVEVEKSYGNLPEIVCFPSQLNQVFLNILINAAQAIDGEGRIALSTSVDGDTVVIEVQDSGVGID